MAEILGVNAAKISAGQGSKINKGEVTGRLHMLYDEKTFTAEVAVNDTIKLGAPLPAGARVVGGKIKCEATGATGIFKVGYQANGVDLVDDDAFATNQDPGAAAVLADLSGAGIGKKFTVATQVEATCTEITAAATGKLFQIWLFYVVD